MTRQIMLAIATTLFLCGCAEQQTALIPCNADNCGKSPEGK